MTDRKTFQQCRHLRRCHLDRSSRWADNGQPISSRSLGKPSGRSSRAVPRTWKISSLSFDIKQSDDTGPGDSIPLATQVTQLEEELEALTEMMEAVKQAEPPMQSDDFSSQFGAMPDDNSFLLALMMMLGMVLSEEGFYDSAMPYPNGSWMTPNNEWPDHLDDTCLLDPFGEIVCPDEWMMPDGRMAKSPRRCMCSRLLRRDRLRRWRTGAERTCPPVASSYKSLE